MANTQIDKTSWWNDLRHQGALISGPVLKEFFGELQIPNSVHLSILRNAYNTFDTWLNRKQQSTGGTDPLHRWCDAVLENFLYYKPEQFAKTTKIPDSLVVNAITGDRLRSHRILFGDADHSTPLLAIMIETPVRTNDGYRPLGVGRGRTNYGKLLEYLRGAKIKLGLLTNGIQFRLCYAGADHEAWAEWDIRSWFEEEELRRQLYGFFTLLGKYGTESRNNWSFPLLEAVEVSRSKQAELASVMGQQIRSSVELLIDRLNIAKIQTPDLLDAACNGPSNQKATDRQVREAAYQAATRIIMRIVVVLFAEARGLLSRSQLVYDQSYGVEGLFEQLRLALYNEGHTGLEDRHYAWPRLLALFNLVHDGYGHPDLIIPPYGGLLFRRGDPQSSDVLLRVLSVFESEKFRIPDSIVYAILERLKIGRVKIRQGRTSTMVAGPVDFSDLKTEFIGMMYEGLLDFELRSADEPLVILNLGQEPILPLNLLESKSDKELKDLIEKLSKEKAKGPVSADEEADEGENEPEEEVSASEEGVSEEETEVEEVFIDENDRRRSKAIEWAKRAVRAAGLVKKKKTEDDYYYQKRLDRVAQNLIIKVLDKDEFYLARWGGTRKGTGTFYTKPGLAVPTARRTLFPLLYDKVDGKEIPKTPEQILAIKVCDPACGSASFLVAALHYITDALYRSLIYHRKIDDIESKQVLTLPYGTRSAGAAAEDLLPIPPDDERFEDMVRSRLRRHVVERCIYGVDLNPMAVELARLSLWIETMDPELPFGFLDHKIKVGNSLVGCWFDRFQDYPLAAWLREGGNDEASAKITDYLKGVRGANNRRPGFGLVLEQMKSLLLRRAGVMAFGFHDQTIAPENVHDQSMAILEKIHEMPVADPAKREQEYRKSFLANDEFCKLKEAFDGWCSLWFWPTDRFEEVLPGPSEFSHPGMATRAIVNALAEKYRFFHWELEFPDVFGTNDSGFDAVLGNPPWEISKPNSKEFFSNYDPIYRTYGKQEALQHQESLIAASPEVGREWTEYCAYFKSMSHWNRSVAHPFGDYTNVDDKTRVRLSSSGRESNGLHDSWRNTRAKRLSYVSRQHPFLHQGSADINLYKMFTEVSYALLKPQGRLGMITPSGIYTDGGTKSLRDLFIDNSQWEWLFGFENRKKIFDIDTRFKFCPIIVQKSGGTKAINTAFMRHDLKDWEDRAEELSTPYEKSRVTIFSPKSKALLELRSKRDIEIVEKIYANSVLLGDQSEDGWKIKYSTEFHMTNDSHLFKPRPWWEERGYKPDAYGQWIGPDGDIALPLYEGRMIGQFDFCEKGWVSGKGRSAQWRDIDWSGKTIEPQYLMPIEHCEISQGDKEEGRPPVQGYKVPLMNISSATNSRTAICSFAKDWPCNHSLNPLRVPGLEQSLFITAILNSFVYDFLVRVRLGGLNLSFFVLDETAVPSPAKFSEAKALLLRVASLSLCHQLFAPEWLLLQRTVDLKNRHLKSLMALTPHERTRLRCTLDSIVAELYGLEFDDLEWILRNDHSDPKGFWRVDQDKSSELRQTTLTLLAFGRLREVGIDKFLAEDWQFPKQIADRLGPRYLNWQKPNATAEEIKQSWEECETHAHNILGEEGFKNFMLELKEDKKSGDTATAPKSSEAKQGKLI